MDFKDFMGSSTLDIIVPEATVFDIEAACTSEDSTNDVTKSIEQRSLLYFGPSFIDEFVSVYVVLSTSLTDENILKSYIDRLVVNLEVQAYGFQHRASVGPDEAKETSPSRSEDILWSGNVDRLDNPVKIVPTSTSQGADKNLSAFWRIQVPLPRPRMRLQSPMVAFKPSATLNPNVEGHDEDSRDPYLPNSLPASINILESLKSGRTLNGALPKLSAARLSGIAPVTHSAGMKVATIKTSPQKPFRALPVMSSRVRYAKANLQPGRTSIIASLDIDTSPFTEDEIEITDVTMELIDGLFEDAGKGSTPSFPLVCQPKDNVVCLYKLSLNQSQPNEATQNHAKTVSITILATVLTSQTCRPRIVMRWKTSVDFSTPLNPMYGAPGQSMQRSNRPRTLSTATATSAVSNLAVTAQDRKSSIRPTKSLSTGGSVSTGELGISITFTAPKTVWSRERFSLSLLMLNRSSRTRQLAITALSKNNNGFKDRYLSCGTAGSDSSGKKAGIAEAVIDEDALQAVQKHGSSIAAQLISLSMAVNTEPLTPGSCITMKLDFVALIQGFLQLDAIRITDTVSNDFVDIRDMPDIIVTDHARNID